MQIPKSFKLCGLTINVVRDNTMVANKHCIGEARYAAQEILIDTEAASKELTEQSFLHELLHWCFYVLGEEELRDNERLVDTLAHLLYQYETTKEIYEPNTTRDNTTETRQDIAKISRP